MSKKAAVSLVSAILVAILGGLGWYFLKDFNPRKTVTLAGEESKIKVEVEELGFYDKDNYISGTVYRPLTDEKKYPVVIYCPPLASDRSAGDDLCRQFAAKGWVAYAFDFRGGSRGGKSTQLETTSMSVETQAADIASVVKGLRKVNYIQDGKMFLVGEGFGGYAALLAAQKGLSVKGMALIGAEYNRSDESRESYPKVKDIPTVIDKGYIVLGRAFYKDSRDYDPFKKASRIKVPTLIIHGTSDEITPMSYASRMAQEIPVAQIVPYDGAPHKLGSSLRKKAGGEIISFVSDKL